MASPPNSSLPISNPPSTQSQPSSLATPAFRAFVARLTESLRLAFNHRRPWYELIDRSAFTRPDSVTEAASRVRKNFSYFRINYLSLLSLVLALSLLTHPFSLITLLFLLSSWLFLYFFRPSDSPLVVFNRQFSDRETLGILILLTIVVIFLTSVGSVLISALVIGLGMVCVHGAFRVPEDLFLDDQDSSVGGSGGGFLSFLGGAASSAAAAAGPAVASRV